MHMDHFLETLAFERFPIAEVTSKYSDWTSPEIRSFKRSQYRFYDTNLLQHRFIDSHIEVVAVGISLLF